MQAETPLVRHFMTPNPLCIDGELTIADAFARMLEINARHLPVYVRSHLVGVISERDIGRLYATKGVDPEQFTAAQAVMPDPYVCTPDTPLEQAVQVLIDHKIEAAVVMESDKLRGMFTVIDAMQALVAVLHRDAAQAVDPAHQWTASTIGPTRAS